MMVFLFNPAYEMDKRYLTKAIVVATLLHLAILVFYVTSFNPINHFSSVGDDDFISGDNYLSTKLSITDSNVVIREERTFSHNGTPFNENIGSVLDWRRQTNASDRTEGVMTSHVKDLAPSYGSSLIYSGATGLTDKDHPQYQPSFPRNLKPAYLLNWVPAPDSHVHFQPIRNIDAQVYSAFYLDCALPSIRLFAMTHRSSKHLGLVFCHYLDVQKTWIESKEGSLRPMRDHNELEYTDAYVDCQITPGIQPFYVSVTRNPDLDASTNQVTIQYPGTQRRNFSMCFSPLHSNYNATFRLIQSIEFNRLLGASHFYFYNFSTSPQTDQILGQYEKEGLVTVLPWPLPHLETWYYGQILAINDCIYRNRMTSRFVVVVDTDEFIIPSRHFNWLDLINDVISSPQLRDADVDIYTEKSYRTCRAHPNMESKSRTQKSINYALPLHQFGSFSFKCSYFAKRTLDAKEQQVIQTENVQLTNEQGEFFELFPSEPMVHLKRNDYFYDHGKRAKLIVRPETVVFHGIHKTEEHYVGYQTAYVKSDAAYVHHYRPDKVKLSNTLDFSALRFKDPLYLRLNQAVKKFSSIFPQFH